MPSHVKTAVFASLTTLPLKQGLWGSGEGEVPTARTALPVEGTRQAHGRQVVSHTIVDSEGIKERFGSKKHSLE